MASLPRPRGPWSERFVAALSVDAGALEPARPAVPDQVLGDDDAQLALYVAYELHYRGFDDVDPAWEWAPDLLAERHVLEQAFEAELRDLVGPPASAAAPGAMDLALRAIADADDAPPVSRHIERHATLEQLRELCIHRSAYQLKEADQYALGLPRLSGPPKAAMVEILADEFGNGRPDRIHAELFATTMRELGLDDTYGASLDAIPGTTLAGVNLLSLFGLHRRLIGALVGHLALFEMTSSVPSGRYARGFRRLGLPEAASEFFDVHVLADAVHENIAAIDLAGGLATQRPDRAADILWGARALVAVDGIAARQMMSAWEAGVSSLLGTPVHSTR